MDKVCCLCQKAYLGTKDYFWQDSRRKDGLQPRCRYCQLELRRAGFAKTRKQALDHYGGKCECCGETRYEFLQLDHIDGNGSHS